MIQYPFEVDGLTTRVLESGSGERALLLVHGVGARADRWSSNIDELAQRGYRVIAFDLPGHGFATKGARPTYTVPAFARFAGRMLDQLEVSRCAALVGTSLGGHVAATLALQRPALTNALVLVGTLGVVARPDGGRHATRARLSDVTPASIDAKLHAIVHDQSLVTAAWQREELMHNTSPGASEALASLGAYVADGLDDDGVGEPLAAAVRAGALRTLVVWGANEVAYPVSMGCEVAARLGAGPLATIRDGRHVSYLEHPAVFDALVDDFVNRRALGDYAGHVEWRR